MAIDARIPALAVQGVSTPLQNIGGMFEVQQAQQAQQANALKLREAERQQQERAAIQQILTESGGDLSDETLQRVTQIAPDMGLKLQESVLKNRKSLYDAMDAETKAEAAELQEGLRWLGAAKADPSLYPKVWADAVRKNGDLGKMLRDKPNYDPARIDAIMQAGMAAEKQVEAHTKILDAFRKGDYRYAAGVMAQVLPTMDPEDAQELAQGALFAGMPKEMRDAVLANPSAFAMTEAERQTAADRKADNERQAQAAAAAAEERAIDNKRADAQLNLSRQRLAQGGVSGDGGAAGAPLVDAILANPALFDGLTPTAKTAVIPGLAAKGFKFPTGAGTTAAGGAKLSAAAIEKIAGADTALASLGQIETLYDKYTSSMGPVMGRLSESRQSLPGADEGFAEFLAEVATLKNAVVKATTGAAMSEPEAQRIMSQVPDIRNQPEVFKARLIATKRNLEMMRKRTIELSGGAESAPSVTPAGGGDATKVGRFTVREKK